MSSSSSSPAAPRIFSPAEWNTLYSKEDYQKKERALPYLLHFLIAKSQPETTILSSINSVKKEKLVAHDPQNHGLTPLIIAAMKGDERVVEELLKQDLVKKNIDATDEYGWTALHHAALTSDVIFQQLIAAGAKANPLTKLKGAPADLRALTTSGSQGESMQSVFFEGKPLTPEIAQERFSLTYRDTSFYPPECLKGLWQQKMLNAGLIADYSLPPRRAPRLEIIALDKDFYGLVAGEDLPAGTTLGDYPGLWVNAQEDCSSFPYAFPREQDGKTAYFFGDFDAKRIGNITRFANNGFPNMLPIASVNDGVNKRTFVTGEAIKKGEPILFNYGAKSYNVTYGPELLFNRDKIHAFFKRGLDAIIREERGGDYLKKTFLASRLLFPMDNPLCLIDLHFSKIIDVKEWLKRLLETEQTRTLSGGLLQIWEEQHGCLIATHLKEMVLRLSKIDQNIQQNAPNHYPLFQNWVLDHCQKLPLIDLMKGMDWIEEALVVKKDPSLVVGIEARLGSHDWSRDEEHLYSYASRKKGFERQLDFGLLRHPKISDSNFFENKEFSLRETLKNCAQYANFAGSALEKMLRETLDSLPLTVPAQAQYLARAKAELKETQDLIK